MYADSLCISVHYLCEIIYDASGHYPKYWIDETLTSEAKYLLCYTDRSAAAISAELNFSNPAFFSRFFKRETGLTPGEFRLRHAQVQDLGQKICSYEKKYYLCINKLVKQKC